MTRFAISMGSNLGDRIGHLRGAIRELSNLVSVEAVSSLYETEPVGGPEQDPYLNAVAVVQTDRNGHDLLEVLQGIEADHGREREVRWGPRTLDLDLVAYDGSPIDDHPDLVIPHPRAAERRFVLEPLAEVWPGVAVNGAATANHALERVADQNIDLLARSWVEESVGQGRLWVGAQLVAFAAIGVVIIGEGSLPADLSPLRIGGAILLVSGFVVMVWSARALGRGLTAVPEPVPGADLVVTGPYRWVRHPIYTAVVAVLSGTSALLAAPTGAILSFLLFGFFAAKAGYEERRLRISYPQYASYRSRVRARFVPKIY
jgi:2-amino-4-hydroxy-6-hydroxymethyldihydropteridine diphosphokinase